MSPDGEAFRGEHGMLQQIILSADLSHSSEMVCLISLGSADNVMFSGQKCLGTWNAGALSTLPSTERNHVPSVSGLSGMNEREDSGSPKRIGERA